MIRRVLGKDLHCLPDQSAPDLDVAALEKRRCNALLAKFCRFERGLDAFAGVGVSSRYWSGCTNELYLVENRANALCLLRKNLPAIARPGCRVKLVPGTAREFLENAARQGLQFDLVDCDPFGTCYDLLPLVTRLVPRGVVCVTTGEIFQVYRGLNRRPGRPPADEFRGHKVSQWVLQSLLPEISGACGGASIVHFYAYPSSVRIILALGGFPAPQQAFAARPHFLGWLASEGAGLSPQGPARDSRRSVG
jgi:hypothetical protein